MANFGYWLSATAFLKSFGMFHLLSGNKIPIQMHEWVCVAGESAWTAMNHSSNLKQHGWLSTFFSRNQNLTAMSSEIALFGFHGFFPPCLHSNLPTFFKKNDIKWNNSVSAPLVLQGNSGSSSTLQWRRRSKLLVDFWLGCHLYPSIFC